jgi:hypothetical protein
MIFGDYAADCSKIEFGDGGRRPIPHLRYTTSEDWRVQRGTRTGTNRDCMHAVYSEIVASRDFSGTGFSAADRYIADAAGNKTAPHGNAKVWRQLNTTHHITQVVDDIVRIRGDAIKRSLVEKEIQSSLFPPKI